MTMKKEEKLLFDELDRIYSSRACPVLFVRRNLAPFYANAAAQMYYPSLCRNGLSPFVSDRTFSSSGLISLSGNQNSSFEEYILSPVYFQNSSVFRVQLLADAAAEERLRSVLRRDYSVKQACDEAEKELRRLTRALNRIRKGFGDISSAENSALALKETVRRLSKRIGGDMDEENVCFDPYQILVQATFCLRGFSVKDQRSVSLLIYSDKVLFLRAVFLGCGYLNQLSDCEGEIFCTAKNRADEIVLSFERQTRSPGICPDDLLARCEETLINSGGKLSFSLSADRVSLLFHFPGYSYSPADFLLSENDIMVTFSACEDLADLPGLFCFFSPDKKDTAKDQEERDEYEWKTRR